MKTPSHHRHTIHFLACSDFLHHSCAASATWPLRILFRAQTPAFHPLSAHAACSSWDSQVMPRVDWVTVIISPISITVMIIFDRPGQATRHSTYTATFSLCGSMLLFGPRLVATKSRIRDSRRLAVAVAFAVFCRFGIDGIFVLSVASCSNDRRWRVCSSRRACDG